MKKGKRILAWYLSVLLTLFSNVSIFQQTQIAYAEADFAEFSDFADTEYVYTAELAEETEIQNCIEEKDPYTESYVAPIVEPQGVWDDFLDDSVLLEAIFEENEEAVEPEVKIEMNEETILRYEVKDADNRLLEVIEAKIPEGTFEVGTDEIEMKIEAPKPEQERSILTQISEKLPEQTALNRVLEYKVSFWAAEQEVQPMREILLRIWNADVTEMVEEEMQVFRLEENGKVQNLVHLQNDSLERIYDIRIQSGAMTNPELMEFYQKVYPLDEEEFLQISIRGSGIIGFYETKELPVQITESEDEFTEDSIEEIIEVPEYEEIIEIPTEGEEQESTQEDKEEIIEEEIIEEEIAEDEISEEESTDEGFEESEELEEPEEASTEEEVEDELEEEPAEEDPFLDELPEPAPAFEQSCEINDVLIHVTALDENAIPENAVLHAEEITREANSEKYAEVESMLSEKAEADNSSLAAFLAYDIWFEVEDGTRIEPDGRVFVTIQYQEKTIPAELVPLEAKETDFTAAALNNPESDDSENISPQYDIEILHFTEDEQGNVKEIVNLAENGQLESLEITENQEVEQISFVTDSFSTYVVLWNGNGTVRIELRQVNKDGATIGSNSTTTIMQDLPSGERVTISDILNYVDPIENYIFTEARIRENWNTSSTDPFEWLEMEYDYSQYKPVWKYGIAEDGSDTKSFSSYEANILLIYDTSEVPVKIVDTKGNIFSSQELKSNVDGSYNIQENIEAWKPEGCVFSGAKIVESGQTFETGKDVTWLTVKADSGMKWDYGVETGVTADTLTAKPTLYLIYEDPRVKFIQVDEAGNPLGDPFFQNLSDTPNVKHKMEDIGNSAAKLGLEMAEAKIHLGVDDIPIKWLSYELDSDSNGHWVYGTTENDDEIGIELPDKPDVELVYKMKELDTIATVDNELYGIKMRMLNYNGNDGKGGKTNSNGDQHGIQIGGLFKGEEDPSIIPGCLAPVLVAGYPVTVGGNSLRPLFTGDSVPGTTPIDVRNANHLFSQSIYNSSGYFSYDCDENYAYFDKDTGNFKVYADAVATPNGNPKDYESWYRKGNFLPYDDINVQKLSQKDDLYWIENADFNFGMYLEADFFQAKRGMVGSNPMIFEFDGDDDMWVYLDNVLLLDLGGIHQAAQGKIDFSTGDISGSTGGKLAQPFTDTIKACFERNHIFPDGTAWDPDKVDQYFVGNTLKEYTPHTFKMFYMERGQGASNLKMKFNLPTIPNGSIQAKKELLDENGEEVTFPGSDRIEYKFKIVEYNESGEEAAHVGKQFRVLDANGVDTDPLNEHPRYTSDAGIFTLKTGETAVFNSIIATGKYKIYELGAYIAGYEVQVNDIGVQVKDEFGNPVNLTTLTDVNPGLNAATTEIQSVDSDPYSLFTNKITKTAKLDITKKLDNSFSDEFISGNDDEFLVYVTFEGVPYNGDYKIGTAEHTTTDGYIKLKKSETATIEGIPYGIKYQVREVVDDGYYIGEHKNDGYRYDETSGTGTDPSAEAHIAGDTQVEITNKPNLNKKINIQAEKKWLDTDGNDAPPPESVDDITLLLYKKKDGAEVPCLDMIDISKQMKLTLSAANDWKGEFTDLPYYYEEGGKVFVQEYVVKEQIDGAEPETLGIQSTISMVPERDTSTGVDRIGAYKVTAENKYANKLTVKKQWKDPTSPPVDHSGDTIYVVIYKSGGQLVMKDGQPLYVTLNATNEWQAVITMDDIVKNNYQVKELRACTAGETSEFTIDGADYIGMEAADKIEIEGIEYTVSYKGALTETQTVTNSADGVEEPEYSIEILKRSETNTGPVLSGVKFALFDQNGIQIGSVGTTDANGILKFEELEAQAGGTVYFLKEVETVEGYCLLGAIQKITMWPGSADKVKYTIEPVVSMDNNSVTASEADATEAENTTVKMTVVNYKLYSLPSTGHEGIFWYIFAGIAIMMVAELCIYKRRCREVLKS